MEWYQALFLGIVQGLTEFLPISSSGHLVLFSNILNVESSISFDVAVHIGTLFAVLVFYRKKLFALIKSPVTFMKHIILASLPAAFSALFFKTEIEKLFNMRFLPIGFMLSAVMLYLSDKLSGEKSVDNKSALSAGLFQAIALLPGVSRSGSTIFGARLLNAKKEESVDFSFLMSIPVIVGGGLLTVFDSAYAFEPISFSIGAASAFIFGLISIKLTVTAVKKSKMKYFAIYLAILSVAITVYNII